MDQVFKRLDFGFWNWQFEQGYNSFFGPNIIAIFDDFSKCNIAFKNQQKWKQLRVEKSRSHKGVFVLKKKKLVLARILAKVYKCILMILLQK